MSENKPVKLDANKIMKSLPEGFTGVSVPKNTRIVYLEVDPNVIDAKSSSKAVKKLADELKLSVVKSYLNGTQYKLEDKAMTKQMRIEANTCFKAVKSFFSKYRIACMFDDTTCGILHKMTGIIDNE